MRGYGAGSSIIPGYSFVLPPSSSGCACHKKRGLGQVDSDLVTSVPYGGSQAVPGLTPGVPDVPYTAAALTAADSLVGAIPGLTGAQSLLLYGGLGLLAVLVIASAGKRR
jgi:hypothetical protein